MMKEKLSTDILLSLLIGVPLCLLPSLMKMSLIMTILLVIIGSVIVVRGIIASIVYLHMHKIERRIYWMKIAKLNKITMNDVEYLS